MKVNVLFFGIFKDLVNQNNLEFNLNEPCTIKDFKEAIFKDYSNLKSYSFSIAVNETYQKDTFNLKNGDIIALIPPVSGG